MTILKEAFLTHIARGVSLLECCFDSQLERTTQRDDRVTYPICNGLVISDVAGGRDSAQSRREWRLEKDEAAWA